MNVMNPGELWQWNITGVTVTVLTTFTATGHGLDPCSMILPSRSNIRKSKLGNGRRLHSVPGFI
jgi:hypothetical protein